MWGKMGINYPWGSIFLIIFVLSSLYGTEGKLESPELVEPNHSPEDFGSFSSLRLVPKKRLEGAEEQTQKRVRRGAAYPGGHGDFSGVAKMSTFASLGAYGGFLGHGGGAGGSVAGGYNAGSGNSGRGGDGGITISGALGSYGGYLGHYSPVVISSGGYGNGGLLFGKI